VSTALAQVGQEVTLTGSAGNGCVVDKSWDGFSFERSGGTTTGPVTEMATPVASDGSWSALFIVPSYLGGSAKRGPGALVSPGRYQFTAPDCTGHKLAKASLVVQ